MSLKHTEAHCDFGTFRPGAAEQTRPATPAERLGHAARRTIGLDQVAPAEQSESFPGNATLSQTSRA